MKHADALAAKAAAALVPLLPRFEGQTALVFAPGPSLRDLWEGRCSELPKIAVTDAYPVVPNADILYATDAHWWHLRQGVPRFMGVRVGYETVAYSDLARIGRVRAQTMIVLQGSGVEGYDERLGWVRHGSNSGHAAVHLAAQLGAKRVVLVGFDMREVNGRDHCAGVEPPARKSNYPTFVQRFQRLAEEMKERGIDVVNATPGSALPWFPMVKLEDVL